MSEKIIPVARDFEGEADLDKLVTLRRAVVAEDRDGLTVSVDDLRFEWVEAEPGWVRRLQVWEAGDRFVAAFGNWYQPGDPVGRVYGELEIHPDWREPVFVDEVVLGSIGAVAELVDRPVEHRIGAAGSQTWLQAGLERAGYEADRHFNRMSASVTRPLPEPQIAPGFVIRPLAGDAEVDGWIAAHNEGFSDHYDPPADIPDDKRNQLRSPGYLPEADLVLVDPDGRIVGIGRNLSEKLEDGTEKGWVQSIAVVPEHRGKGLGRALLLASMAALKQAGFKRVYLSADTENESGALQLYSSAGFAIDSRMIVYLRTVIPTDNLQQAPVIP
jgi:ribosomal protein S18 acetylase RimI-like enzyme